MGFFDLFKTTGFSNTALVSLDMARKIKDDWYNIEVLVRAGSPSQLKQALITADRALDSALKTVAAGETMAERLKNSRDRFDRNVYQKMWDAHRLRNNLVHEAGFDPQQFVIKEALENIKYGLRALGVSL